MGERKAYLSFGCKTTRKSILFSLAISPLFLASYTHPPPELPDATVHPIAKRKPSEIHFEVTPGTVVIYLDGRKLGAAYAVGKVRSRPGLRTIRLVKGRDETELQVNVRRSETLNFRYDFGD